MKTKIESQYKMATTATHQTGDISRKSGDICVVFEEDADNYYGNWVVGYGFIDVAFPKATTRDLNAEEIEKYHGQVMMMNNSLMGAINITGEKFNKRVVVTKKGEGKARSGTLVAPIKEDRVIAMITDDGCSFRTSTIKSINGNEVKTRNSVYVVEYVGDSKSPAIESKVRLGYD